MTRSERILSGIQATAPQRSSAEVLDAVTVRAKAAELAGRIAALAADTVTASGTSAGAVEGWKARRNSTPHVDPAGEPSGKIKHAVLVIDGQRFKGHSHFQALMEALKGAPDTEPMPHIEHEGFETESGHFLDRDAAARYMGLKQGNAQSEQVLHVAAVEGKLYTQDAIHASALPSPDAARATAADLFRKVIAKIQATAEARAIGEALHPSPDPATVARLDTEAVNTCLSQFEDAHVNAFDYMISRLQASAAPDAELPPENEAIHFARERREKLKNFAKDAVQTARNAMELNLNEGMNEREARKIMRERMDHFTATRGELAAQTEAQSTYGQAQMDALKAGGFSHKSWLDMDDDRVRHSHRLCGEEGAIPIDQPFSNGLMFPGDPQGPIEELANCRCILVGHGRGAVKPQLPKPTPEPDKAPEITPLPAPITELPPVEPEPTPSEPVAEPMPEPETPTVTPMPAPEPEPEPITETPRKRGRVKVKFLRDEGSAKKPGIHVSKVTIVRERE